MSEMWNRREFVKRLLALSAIGAVLSANGCRSEQPAAPEAETLPSTPPPTAPAGAVDLAVAHGPDADPAELTRRAIAALGGIERFVKKGDDVIVKPNICTAAHTYEYAATTNPQVVGAIVALCVAAGAKRVRVMDAPFSGTPQQAYERSGIAQAVGEAGGVMEVMSPVKYKDTPIPQGKDIKSWPIYQEIFQADVVIDVPIAKHHSLAGLTLAIKNLMGVIIPNGRGRFHRNLHQRLADLATVVRPTLTIVDAVRILTAHGPTGGNLDDVKKMDTVIASSDIVAADAYATTLFGKKPSDIGYIVRAAEMGLGRMDLDALKIEKIAL
ncbi:MAG: DUF362 domain-containing protein [Chloroflexi bacterium]|nr:DUF362 domain-containing protein [Chloroflexota bacterium]